MTLDEIMEKYMNERYIDLKAELTEEEINMLKKFNIQIEDKIYTEYEFDLIMQQLAPYYIDDEIVSKEELDITLPLEPLNITREQYNKLDERLFEIHCKYTN